MRLFFNFFLIKNQKTFKNSRILIDRANDYCGKVTA